MTGAVVDDDDDELKDTNRDPLDVLLLDKDGLNEVVFAVCCAVWTKD